MPRLPDDPRQVGHDPGRPVDAVVGGRLVQEPEYCLLDLLVVELTRGFGLVREQGGMATALECPQVSKACLPVDPQKAANCRAPQPVTVRENGHGPVAGGQAAFVEALKQGPEIGEVADIAAECIQVDVFLQNGAHPFERNLLGLHSAVSLGDNADRATGLPEKLLRARCQYDWGIGAGEQKQKIDGALLLQRCQQIIGIFPHPVPSRRNRSSVVPNRAVCTTEAFLITDVLIDGLDGEAGRRR